MTFRPAPFQSEASVQQAFGRRNRNVTIYKLLMFREDFKTRRIDADGPQGERIWLSGLA
jgi:hypothetical protein